MIIDVCKTSAHELYQYLQNSSWRYLKKWLLVIDKQLQQVHLNFTAEGDMAKTLVSKKRVLMQIIERLVTVAHSDFKNEMTKSESELMVKQCCTTPSHRHVLFTKFELINLVTSTGLLEFIQIFSKQLEGCTPLEQTLDR